MKIKKITLIISLLTLAALSTVTAGTLRVNSSLPTDAARKIYNTLAAAHNASGAGDTLLVEGSVAEYTSLTCTKRLTIIGPGYLLAQNPQNQANALSATVRDITFNAGSEGSAIIGLTFSTGSSGNLPTINVNNVAVMRCYLTNGLGIGSSINNLLVLQNFFQNSAIQTYSSSVGFSNVLLKNNLFAVGLAIDQYSGAPRIFSNVENNIFLGNVKLSANTFLSNIIAAAGATVAVTASSVQNNLMTTSGQLPAATANQVVNANTLFVGLAGAGNSLDAQYKLPAASPYLAAGFGGTQPGLFGGSEPYVLSGVPAIPTIYSLRADAVGSRQNGLNVTIGARVNP